MRKREDETEVREQIRLSISVSLASEKRDSVDCSEERGLTENEGIEGGVVMERSRIVGGTRKQRKARSAGGIVVSE